MGPFETVIAEAQERAGFKSDEEFSVLGLTAYVSELEAVISQLVDDGHLLAPVGAAEGNSGPEPQLMGCFVVPTIIEAGCADEALAFLRDRLTAEIHRERPLPVQYIGDPCPVGRADCYSTEEIHLLRDGMREIAVPTRGA